MHISKARHHIFSCSIDATHAPYLDFICGAECLDEPVFKHEGLIGEETLFVQRENCHMGNS
jgi:hypothetical protein